MTDHDLLGVSPNADLAELRRAWHKFAARHHPDSHDVPDRELFQRGEQAFRRLAAAKGATAGWLDWLLQLGRQTIAVGQKTVAAAEAGKEATTVAGQAHHHIKEQRFGDAMRTGAGLFDIFDRLRRS